MMTKLFQFVLLFSIILFFNNCDSEQAQQSAEQIVIDYPTMGYLEKLDDKFDKIVPPNTKIEIIDTGHVWTEGPVWLADEQALVFSDVPKNIAYKWTAKNGREVFLNPSGYTGEKENQQGSNGLFLDLDGNLILCKNGNRMIARLNNNSEKPSFDTIATTFDGKRFNAPNDLVISKHNHIYFTDPNYGMNLAEKEMDFQGVYKINTQNKVSLQTQKHATPNGIGLSPDNSKLYIANSEPAYLTVCDLDETGNVISEKVLFDIQEIWENSNSKQHPDGMSITKDGIIFLAGPDGVFVLEPDGTHLGTIRTDKLTSNCVLNKDESVLYVTCHQLILRVKLK